MIKYDLTERHLDIRYADRFEIKEDCTAYDSDYEIIESFDTLEEAEKELKKYDTRISLYRTNTERRFEVVEYAIEQNEYDDEDGEMLSLNGGCGTTPMQIEVLETETYKSLGICSSYREAQDIVNNYDGENGAFIDL